MLRPNFEAPLDTVQQMVDNNVTLYMGPQMESWKNFLAESPLPEYNKLGETMILCDSWDEFDYYSANHNLPHGTHVMMWDALMEYEKEMGRWWRSKETLRA